MCGRPPLAGNWRDDWWNEDWWEELVGIGLTMINVVNCLAAAHTKTATHRPWPSRLIFLNGRMSLSRYFMIFRMCRTPDQFKYSLSLASRPSYVVPTSLSHGIKLVNPMFRGYAQQVQPDPLFSLVLCPRISCSILSYNFGMLNTRNIRRTEC